jgi:hypothetical protein
VTPDFRAVFGSALAIGRSDDALVTADVLVNVAGGLSGARLDWDEGAGEEWARIADTHGIVALIHLHVPLALVAANHADELDLAKHLPTYSIATVANMDAPILSAHHDDLETLAGRKVSSAIDPEEFSANDLWWVTV